MTVTGFIVKLKQSKRLVKFKKNILPSWHNLVPEIEKNAKIYPSLHLGSGISPIEGAVTVDINPRLNPDVVWNLNEVPYPFKDNTFDIAIAFSIIEHLDDFFSVMGEIHRICRNNAAVYILVPHFSSAATYVDPSHRRGFSARSCDYFIAGTPINSVYGFYTDYRYEMVRRYVSIQGFLSKLPGLEILLSRAPVYWEEHLCYIIRGAGIFWQLRVIK